MLVLLTLQKMLQMIRGLKTERPLRLYAGGPQVWQPERVPFRSSRPHRLHAGGTLVWRLWWLPNRGSTGVKPAGGQCVIPACVLVSRPGLHRREVGGGQHSLRA